MIRILYFASLRERLGQSEEQLPDVPADIASLRATLCERGSPWSDVFATDQRVLAAVNQEMVTDAATLQPGDEVGFFPPVTGG